MAWDVVNVQDYSGNTALHCVANKKEPCAVILLAAGTNLALLNSHVSAVLLLPSGRSKIIMLYILAGECTR